MQGTVNYVKKKRVVSKAFISDSDEELSSEREDTT